MFIQKVDGIRLDNEPQVLMLWYHTKRRPELLREFLELNEECQSRCAEAGLEFGIDIPTWWNLTDQVTNQPSGLVTYRDETKSADLFCIDLLDSVGLLNYRDAVYGLDSRLAGGAPLLDYAASVGMQNVVMGIETAVRPPVKVWFAPGLPYDEFEAAMDGKGLQHSYFSRFQGFKTRVISDGVLVHVGIDVPDDMDIQAFVELKRAFKGLSSVFGVAGYSRAQFRDNVQIAVDSACNAIEQSPEYINGCEKRSFGSRYPLLVTTNIELPKLSFADESFEFFETELAKSEFEFKQYPSYAGEAIHFYTSFKEKYLDM